MKQNRTEGIFTRFTITTTNGIVFGKNMLLRLLMPENSLCFNYFKESLDKERLVVV